MKKIKLLLMLICISMLTACQGENSDVTEAETGNDSQAALTAEITEELENSVENIQDTSVVHETSERIAPTKEQVLSARKTVLDGMTTEQIERLTENIKVANIQMEQAYLYDDIFGKLENQDSL